MKNKLLFTAFLTIMLCYIITLTILNFLGSQDRTGYFEITRSSENTYLSKGATYEVELHYPSRILKNNLFFNVYISKDSLPKTIEAIFWKNLNHNKGDITTNEKYFIGDKIENVKYTLKINDYWWRSLVLTLILSFIAFLIFKHNENEKIRTINSISFWVMFSLLIFLTIYFVTKNLSVTNWTLSDDQQFINSTVQGQGIWPYNWGTRFYPLGFMLINLLIPFGNNPFVYLLQNNIVFILMLTMLFYTLKNYSNKYISITLCIALLGFPSVSGLYSSIIFPESVILLYFTLFSFFFYKAFKTNNTAYYILAGIFVSISTYCKEPVFGLFLVFSIFFLIFYKEKLKQKQKIFFYFLILNAVVFVFLYFINSFTLGNNYTSGRDGGNGYAGILLHFIKTNYVFVVFLIIALLRGYYILIKKDRTQIIADAFLFSGIAYCFAYIFLKIMASYYFAPAYIFFLVAVSKYIESIFQSNSIKKLTYKKILQNSLVKYMLFCLFFCCIALFTLNLTNNYKNLNGVIERRSDTTQYVNALVAFEKSGYNLQVYYPKELSIGPLAINDWYLNAFDIFLNTYINHGVFVQNEKHIDKYVRKDPIHSIDLSANDILFLSPISEVLTTSEEVLNDTQYYCFPFWTTLGFTDIENKDIVESILSYETKKE